MLRFAVGRQSAAAERVRVGPGARGVDHRAREIASDRPSPCVDRQQRTAARSRPRLVTLSMPWRVDRDHAHACLDDSRHPGRRRQRLQIVLVELRACRHALGRRLPPPVCREQFRARRHRCCSATAKRCAHGPSRARWRRPSPRPRRRAPARRARSDAPPPRGPIGSAADHRDGKLGIAARFAAAMGVSNAWSSGSLLRIPNSGIFEISAAKREAHAASLPSPDAQAVIHAAFVGEKAQQRVHRRIIRPADERRRLPLLRHQPGQDQPVQMMRQRRGGDPQLLLQPCRPAGRHGPPARGSDRPAGASGCPTPRAAWRRVPVSCGDASRAWPSRQMVFPELPKLHQRAPLQFAARAVFTRMSLREAANAPRCPGSNEAVAVGRVDLPLLVMLRLVVRSPTPRRRHCRDAGRMREPRSARSPASCRDRRFRRRSAH